MNLNYQCLQTFALQEFTNLATKGLLNNLNFASLDGRTNCIYSMITGDPNSKEAVRHILDCSPILIDNKMDSMSIGAALPVSYGLLFFSDYGKSFLRKLKHETEYIDTTERCKFFLTPLEMVSPYAGCYMEKEKRAFINSLIRNISKNPVY